MMDRGRHFLLQLLQADRRYNAVEQTYTTEPCLASQAFARRNITRKVLHGTPGLLSNKIYYF